MFHSGKAFVFSIITLGLASNLEAEVAPSEIASLPEVRSIYDLEVKKFQCVGMNSDGSIDLAKTLSIAESGREEVLDTQNDPVTGQAMRYVKTLRYSATFSNNPLAGDSKELLPLSLQFLDVDKLGVSAGGVHVFNVDLRTDELLVGTNGKVLMNKSDVELARNLAENIATSLVVLENKEQLKAELENKVYQSVGAWVRQDSEALEKLNANAKKSNLGVPSDINIASLINAKTETNSPLSMPQANTLSVQLPLGNSSILNTPLSLGGGIAPLQVSQGSMNLNLSSASLDSLSQSTIPNMQRASLSFAQGTSFDTQIQKGAILLNSSGENSALALGEEQGMAAKITASLKHAPKTKELAKPVVDKLLKELETKALDANAVLAVPYSSNSLFFANAKDKMQQHIYLCHIETELELED